MKTAPVYKGERLDRTTKERLLCDTCSRLATHRARELVIAREMTRPLDRFLCDAHTKEAIMKGDIHQARVLTEYRRYLRRQKEWEALQHAGDQGAMF